jgi:dolichol-phosphate mannosyltransferase
MEAGERVEAASRTGRARDAWSRWADLAWRVAKRIHLGTRRPGNWVQLFKFGVVGASGYFINLAVFWLLAEPVDTHHIPAAIGAFCVAVTNNFLWNRHWTFQATAVHPAHQGARFLAVSVVGLGVNLAVLELLVSSVGVAELPSQAIAVAIAMPVNFIGNKLWTFDEGASASPPSL